MTFVTPCQAGDPEDWFLDKTGRQYHDDEILTKRETHRVLDDLSSAPGRPGFSSEEAEIAIELAEAEKLKANLVRRRHARDACFRDCILREHCLDVALKTRPTNGTWGGYFEEQLRSLYSQIDARKAAKKKAATSQE